MEIHSSLSKVLKHLLQIIYLKTGSVPIRNPMDESLKVIKDADEWLKLIQLLKQAINTRKHLHKHILEFQEALEERAANIEALANLWTRKISIIEEYILKLGEVTNKLKENMDVFKDILDAVKRSIKRVELWKKIVEFNEETNTTLFTQLIKLLKKNKIIEAEKLIQYIEDSISKHV
ncbi:MAG: hypothetical protein ACTSPL_07290 [Candidatus Odinarchaeia archaeon]